jgi:NADH-quinone oxidoreductase subunit H
MTSVELFLAIVKILIVILFLLNTAAIATWADRRQSAMVQDRVGPNRAVVHLPSMMVRLIVLLPPSILGGIALLPLLRGVRPEMAVQTLPISAQCAVFVAWFSLVVLCGSVRRGGAMNSAEAMLKGIEPRSIFYGGVVAHAVVFAALSAVPERAIVPAAQIAGVVLALFLFVSGIYTASRVDEGTYPLRLAGMLHAAADAMKMIWKEDFIPPKGDKLLHGLAPILALFPALVTFAVIPFGETMCFLGDPAKPFNQTTAFEWSDLGRIAHVMGPGVACRGHLVNLQVADLNVGLLYIFAMAGTGVIGAALAGWASDNKFSLLGGLRAASQMVSYEVAMGISLIGVLMTYGSIQLRPMVQWQSDNAWGIFVQPFAFLLFLTALAAECKRVPFDQPEGESEIVAGYFVEYSGMKWGMFMTGEYVELMTSSAILVTIFFGGFALPFLHSDGLNVAFGDTVLYAYKMNHLSVVIISALAFFGKTIFMTFIQIFFRWTLPRFRYDQLMKLGWTKLLPLSIANMLVTGVVLLAIQGAGPGVTGALRIAADVTQGIVALAFAAGFVAFVVGLLEPVERKRFIKSTTSRFAAAAGGTKATTQQA